MYKKKLLWLGGDLDPPIPLMVKDIKTMPFQGGFSNLQS